MGNQVNVCSEVRLDRKDLLDLFIQKLKNNTFPEFHKFVDFLVDNHFFDNVTTEQLKCILEKDKSIENGFDKCITLQNGKVVISMDLSYFGLYRDPTTFGKIKIGIDPKSCFDSLKRSSIYAEFPMKKRAYKNFINTLDSLFNNKMNFKSWKESAPSEMYGGYLKFV
jgi:hypothetical protein